jgi:cell division protein ZapA
MPRIDVILGGHAYPIQCGEGEEDRVRSIAAYVDGKMAKLRAQSGQAGKVSSAGIPGGPGAKVGEAQLLAMACLLVGDELFDAHAAMRRQADGRQPIAGGEEAVLADTVAQLADHVETLVARVQGT